MSEEADIKFGINWSEMAKKTGQKFIPLIQKHQYCAYHNVGEGAYYHRKERITLLWPKYQWHRWNERRLKADCEYDWLTNLGPASAAKSTDFAVFGLEYWLQAPDRTAVIICSTTAKMLRLRIWSQVTHYHQSLPKNLGPVGDLLDSATRIRWKAGDDKNGVFGMAVEEGPIEAVVNDLVGIHTERVVLILDEMQGIREAIMRATNNMVANPVFRFRGMGNPDSLTNPLGRESEPIEGWDSVVRGETEEWETHGGPTKGKGLCQFFDGRKSPADDSPEEKKRLNWLCNREWYEGILKAAHGNQNDPSVWQFGIGWPPPMGLESTLLDDAIVVTFNCRQKAVWTHGFRQSAALDPAFGGGDKPKLTFIKYGQVESGHDEIQYDEERRLWTPPQSKKRWVIEGGEVLMVPIDAESNRPIHYQLMDFCKVECQKRGIPPNEFALDASGEGGGLKSIFDREWGVVNGIEAGGSASDLPIDDTGKTAKEAYDNRSSELCFSVREFALADGLRGLSNEATFQACNRRTFYRNGKWCVEPKTGSKGRTDEKGRPVRGYKQRMGHSPDDFDSLAVGVMHCREQGAIPALIGAAVGARQPEPQSKLRNEFESDNYLRGYAYV
jgi:hypothetical protein